MQQKQKKADSIQTFTMTGTYHNKIYLVLAALLQGMIMNVYFEMYRVNVSTQSAKWNTVVFLSMEIGSCKVQLLWEGHKNLEFSSTWSYVYKVSKCQINWKIAPTFCGLLRKAEL